MDFTEAHEFELLCSTRLTDYRRETPCFVQSALLNETPFAAPTNNHPKKEDPLFQSCGAFQGEPSLWETPRIPRRRDSCSPGDAVARFQPYKGFSFDIIKENEPSASNVAQELDRQGFPLCKASQCKDLKNSPSAGVLRAAPEDFHGFSPRNTRYTPFNGVGHSRRPQRPEASIPFTTHKQSGSRSGFFDDIAAMRGTLAQVQDLLAHSPKVEPSFHLGDRDVLQEKEATINTFLLSFACAQLPENVLSSVALPHSLGLPQQPFLRQVPSGSQPSFTVTDASTQGRRDHQVSTVCSTENLSLLYRQPPSRHWEKQTQMRRTNTPPPVADTEFRECVIQYNDNTANHCGKHSEGLTSFAGFTSSTPSSSLDPHSPMDVPRLEGQSGGPSLLHESPQLSLLSAGLRRARCTTVVGLHGEAIHRPPTKAEINDSARTAGVPCDVSKQSTVPTQDSATGESIQRPHLSDPLASFTTKNDKTDHEDILSFTTVLIFPHCGEGVLVMSSSAPIVMSVREAQTRLMEQWNVIQYDQLALSNRSRRRCFSDSELSIDNVDLYTLGCSSDCEASSLPISRRSIHHVVESASDADLKHRRKRTRDTRVGVFWRTRLLFLLTNEDAHTLPDHQFTLQREPSQTDTLSGTDGPQIENGCPSATLGLPVHESPRTVAPQKAVDHPSEPATIIRTSSEADDDDRFGSVQAKKPSSNLISVQCSGQNASAKQPVAPTEHDSARTPPLQNPRLILRGGSDKLRHWDIQRWNFCNRGQVDPRPSGSFGAGTKYHIRGRGGWGTWIRCSDLKISNASSAKLPGHRNGCPVSMTYVASADGSKERRMGVLGSPYSVSNSAFDKTVPQRQRQPAVGSEALLGSGTPALRRPPSRSPGASSLPHFQAPTVVTELRTSQRRQSEQQLAASKVPHSRLGQPTHHSSRCPSSSIRFRGTAPTPSRATTTRERGKSSPGRAPARSAILRDKKPDHQTVPAASGVRSVWKRPLTRTFLILSTVAATEMTPSVDVESANVVRVLAQLIDIAKTRSDALVLEVSERYRVFWLLSRLSKLRNSQLIGSTAWNLGSIFFESFFDGYPVPTSVSITSLTILDCCLVLRKKPKAERHGTLLPSVAKSSAMKACNNGRSAVAERPPLDAFIFDEYSSSFAMFYRCSVAVIAINTHVPVPSAQRRFLPCHLIVDGRRIYHYFETSSFTDDAPSAVDRGTNDNGEGAACHPTSPDSPSHASDSDRGVSQSHHGAWLEDVDTHKPATVADSLIEPSTTDEDTSDAERCYLEARNYRAQFYAPKRPNIRPYEKCVSTRVRSNTLLPSTPPPSSRDLRHHPLRTQLASAQAPTRTAPETAGTTTVKLKPATALTCKTSRMSEPLARPSGSPQAAGSSSEDSFQTFSNVPLQRSSAASTTEFELYSSPRDLLTQLIPSELPLLDIVSVELDPTNIYRFYLSFLRSTASLPPSLRPGSSISRASVHDVLATENPPPSPTATLRRRNPSLSMRACEPSESCLPDTDTTTAASHHTDFQRITAQQKQPRYAITTTEVTIAYLTETPHICAELCARLHFLIMQRPYLSTASQPSNSSIS